MTNGRRIGYIRVSSYEQDPGRQSFFALTGRGIRIEFIKEGLRVTGEDSPMSNLMLLVMGVYKGRKKTLSPDQVEQLKERVGKGEQKNRLAEEFGIEGSE